MAVHPYCSESEVTTVGSVAGWERRTRRRRRKRRPFLEVYLKQQQAQNLPLIFHILH